MNTQTQQKMHKANNQIVKNSKPHQEELVEKQELEVHQDLKPTETTQGIEKVDEDKGNEEIQHVHEEDVDSPILNEEAVDKESERTPDEKNETLESEDSEDTSKDDKTKEGGKKGEDNKENQPPKKIDKKKRKNVLLTSVHSVTSFLKELPKKTNNGKPDDEKGEAQEHIEQEKHAKPIHEDLEENGEEDHKQHENKKTWSWLFGRSSQHRNVKEERELLGHLITRMTPPGWPRQDLPEYLELILLSVLVWLKSLEETDLSETVEWIVEIPVLRTNEKVIKWICESVGQIPHKELVKITKKKSISSGIADDIMKLQQKELAKKGDITTKFN